MQETIVDGRLDIVVFPNGGWEFIGKVMSDPPVPEDIYLPEVNRHVAANQNLPAPHKFTGVFRVRDDAFTIFWGDWKGEIPNYAPETVPDFSALQDGMFEMMMPPVREAAVEQPDIEPDDSMDMAMDVDGDSD